MSGEAATHWRKGRNTAPNVAIRTMDASMRKAMSVRGRLEAPEIADLEIVTDDAY